MSLVGCARSEASAWQLAHPTSGTRSRPEDITRIREITSEQQRYADDLARLIDTANAPIFGVDLHGMVTEWNRKAADMLGYTKEETIGKALVQNFIQPEDRRSVQEARSGSVSVALGRTCCLALGRLPSLMQRGSLGTPICAASVSRHHGLGEVSWRRGSQRMRPAIGRGTAWGWELLMELA